MSMAEAALCRWKKPEASLWLQEIQRRRSLEQEDELLATG